MDTDRISSSSTQTTPRAKPLSKDHTDKGLISSSSTLGTPRQYLSKTLSENLESSSSTLPTPRPYRFVSKPLSEDLRSKIIELFGRFYDGNDIEQITKITVCVDPDDPVSVKDYIESPHRFLPISRFYFSPNQIPHTPGEKIVGKPIFELYYIKIKELDPQRNFYSIYIEGTNTDHHPLIIYNRPEDEEITLNQPLLLKNIFRLPSALNTVTINLSNPSCRGWKFWHNSRLFPPHVDYEMRQVDVKDEVTDSVASISYELIKSAVVAELQFTFFDKEDRPITILSGSISATTDGEQSTKRLIRQFSLCTLQSNELVSVNRSVFGVSVGSSLHVELDLNYDGLNRPYRKRTLVFKVPYKTKSVEKDIYITRPSPLTHRNYIAKMKVKVSWWDHIP